MQPHAPAHLPTLDTPHPAHRPKYGAQSHQSNHLVRTISPLMHHNQHRCTSAPTKVRCAGAPSKLSMHHNLILVYTPRGGRTTATKCAGAPMVWLVRWRTSQIIWCTGTPVKSFGAPAHHLTLDAPQPAQVRQRTNQSTVRRRNVQTLCAPHCPMPIHQPLRRRTTPTTQQSWCARAPYLFTSKQSLVPLHSSVTLVLAQHLPTLTLQTKLSLDQPMSNGSTGAPAHQSNHLVHQRTSQII